jgi:CHAT domain-containing protein
VGQSLYLDTIEPLLRDYLRVLLAQPNPPASQLAEAVQILRLNQQAELDNYFGNICQLETSGTPPAREGTATLYTILLPEQAFALLEVARGNYQLFKLPVSGAMLQQQAQDWRQNLTDRFYGKSRSEAADIYDWLVRPLEMELEARKIERLVFVQDGLLRNLPMAALYDLQQQQFLIEKYAISYSLGLGGKLVSQPPSNPLIVGSSQPNPAFPNPLPGVVREMERVQQLLGGTLLYDRALTPSSLADKLAERDYDLLHFAGHSRFPGLADEVKIQVGGEVLDLRQFEALLRKRRAVLRHLTLSACETAAGSRYATLGMAGIGLRAGITSVLGSLWNADDIAVAGLIVDFYRHWQSGQSADESLRQVQIQQIRQKMPPSIWATFVLVGK